MWFGDFCAIVTRSMAPGSATCRLYDLGQASYLTSPCLGSSHEKGGGSSPLPGWCRADIISEGHITDI